MRVLFDHNVPYNLKAHLPEHRVASSAEMGWNELVNGQLIGAAEEDGFEVFVTCDQSIAYQQNLPGRRIAIVEITKNNWPSIKPQLSRIVDAVQAAHPGAYRIVECAYVYQPRRRGQFHG